jgi:hypothetical protein
LKRQLPSYLAGGIILLLIGVPLASIAANTHCSDIGIIQTLLNEPSCSTTGAEEGIGIVLAIIGLLLFVVGFVGTDAEQVVFRSQPEVEEEPVTAPAPTPEPAPVPAVSTTPFSLKSFVKRYRIVLAILLILLIVIPTIVYYEMSYNSVNGTAVQLASGYRSGANGFVSAFYLEIHVWSYATSIDTRIDTPTFSLVVDSLPFGTITTGGGTWQTGGYVSYNLKFQTTDLSVQQAVGKSTANHLVLSIDGKVSAGWFSESVTRSDSVTWTFSS